MIISDPQHQTMNCNRIPFIQGKWLVSNILFQRMQPDLQKRNKKKKQNNKNNYIDINGSLNSAYWSPDTFD